jgi:hypothetical protein
MEDIMAKTKFQELKQALGLSIKFGTKATKVCDQCESHQPFSGGTIMWSTRDRILIVVCGHQFISAYEAAKSTGLPIRTTRDFIEIQKDPAKVKAQPTVSMEYVGGN